MAYDLKGMRNRVDKMRGEAITAKRTKNASDMGLSLIERGIDAPDFMKKAISKRLGAPSSMGGRGFDQARPLATKSLTRSSSAPSFDTSLAGARNSYAQGGDGFVIERSDAKTGQVQSFTSGSYGTPTQPAKANTPDWMKDLANRNAASITAESKRKNMEGIKFVKDFNQDGEQVGMKQMRPNIKTGAYEQVSPAGAEQSEYTKIQPEQYDMFANQYERMSSSEQAELIPEISKANPELFKLLQDRDRKKKVNQIPLNTGGGQRTGAEKYGRGIFGY